MNSQCGSLASLVNFPNGPVVQPVAVPVAVIETCDPCTAAAPVTNSFTSHLKHQFSQKGLWAFIIAAIIVVIIVGWISRGARPFWQSLEKWSWGNNDLIWMILFVVSILLFAWAAFTAFSCLAHNLMKRNWIAAGYGAILLLVIGWAWSFFRKDRDGVFCTEGMSSAKYIIILAAVVALGTLYPMYGCGNAVMMATVPLLVWLVIMALLNYNITCNIELCE